MRLKHCRPIVIVVALLGSLVPTLGDAGDRVETSLANVAKAPCRSGGGGEEPKPPNKVLEPGRHESLRQLQPAADRPLRADPSCDSSTLPSGFKDDLCTDAEPRQHVDEHLGIEQIDAAAHQITDTGLGNTKQLGGLGLFQLARGDHGLQLRHEL
jgi:hypothetical protein